ncbi:MAG: hypothetical protein KAG53_03450 [Endozoicomonadaceae bacterium]|nr:hypothetical protein [Endozoicomonadaceae bacterium]
MNLINNQNHVHNAGISTSRKTCDDSGEYLLANTRLSGSASLLGAVKRKIVLTPLEDNRFATDHNQFNNDSQPQITVTSVNSEPYLAHSNDKRAPSPENNRDDVFHNTKNVSATKRCPSLLNIVQSFFSPFSDMYANGISGTGFSWNPTIPQMVGLLVDLYCPSISNVICFGEVGFYIYMLASIACSNATSTTGIITINNSETWVKIGQDSEYPSSGHYILTNNINLKNYPNHLIKNFTGHLDGQGYSISHQHSCLIEIISGDAILENLILKDVISTNAACISPFADIVSGKALLKNIQVQYARINGRLFVTDYYLKHKAYLDNMSTGIITGTLTDDARIENARVISSTIIIDNGHSNVACMAGRMKEASQIRDSVAINCTARAYGGKSNVGILAGWMSELALSYNNTMIDCTVEGIGEGTSGAIGAGKTEGNSYVTGNTAIGCVSVASGIDGNAGIWRGHQFANASGGHNIAINSMAKATGPLGRAGIVTARISGYSATSPYYYDYDELIINCRVGAVRDHFFRSTYVSGVSEYHDRCQDIVYAGGNFLHNNCTPNREAIYSYWNMIVPDNVTAVLNTWVVPTETSIKHVTSTSSSSLNTASVAIATSVLASSYWYIPIAIVTFGIVIFGYGMGYFNGERGCDLATYPVRKWVNRCNRLGHRLSGNMSVPTEDPDDSTEDEEWGKLPEGYLRNRQVGVAQRNREILEAEQTYFSNGFKGEDIELNDMSPSVSTVNLTRKTYPISPCQDFSFLKTDSSSTNEDRRLLNKNSNVHTVTLHNLDKWSPIVSPKKKEHFEAGVTDTESCDDSS